FTVESKKTPDYSASPLFHATSAESSSASVGLAVKLPYAFRLRDQSLSSLRKPLHTFITFWEAYAP
ncbi:hypothetical protein HPP92_007003, partial [Vanilla planifolia]